MGKIAPAPRGWSSDHLSEYLQRAQENAYHVFHKFSRAFAVWTKIDGVYWAGRGNFEEGNLLARLFFPRAHGSWLAGVRLATSGQLAETYMVLRGCLENALCALFIHEDPESPNTPTTAEIFLRRHDGDAWRQMVRAKFQVGKMLRLLAEKDADIGREAKEMYETAIDRGAHPNEQALSSALTVQRVPGGKLCMTDHFNPHLEIRGLCWAHTALVGMCSLDIFRLMWPERFESLGMAQGLQEVRSFMYEVPEVWTTEGLSGSAPS